MLGGISDHVRIADDRVAWNQMGEEVLVLHLGSSQYYRLNGTAAVLWQRMALGTDDATPEELSATLTDTFGVAPPTAADDVHVFVERLRSFDLLEA